MKTRASVDEYYVKPGDSSPVGRPRGDPSLLSFSPRSAELGGTSEHRAVNQKVEAGLRFGPQRLRVFSVSNLRDFARPNLAAPAPNSNRRVSDL